MSWTIRCFIQQQIKLNKLSDESEFPTRYRSEGAVDENKTALKILWTLQIFMNHSLNEKHVQLCT